MAWYKMNLKGTNFLFGRSPNSQQNLNEKFRERINLKLVCNLKGFNPLDKISINFPKFFLGMIFNTINLGSLTCIQNFEVPLEVENGLKRNIKKEFKFEFGTHLN
jgi:hypothetical protein